MYSTTRVEFWMASSGQRRILSLCSPVFLFTSWLINKDLSQHEEKAEYRIRKWLLYLTLFIAAITVIMRLVALVYRFWMVILRCVCSQNSDCPCRFRQHVWLLFVGCASDRFQKQFSSAHGWHSLRNCCYREYCRRLLLIGSPADQRRARLDERRTNDLSTIQNQVVYCWTNKGMLPKSLKDLNDPINGYTSPLDPETGAEYQYSVVSQYTFKLCADFATASPPQATDAKAIPVSRDLYSQNWVHAKGNVCFERTIDPKSTNHRQNLAPVVPAQK